MKIKGEKIYLKEGLSENDYLLLLKWLNDVENVQYLCWAREALALKNIEDTKKFVAKLENGIIFGIYDYKDNFIGYTSLCDFRGKNQCEFSIFILNPDYRGKGIGKEVTKLMIEYAFNKLDMQKVVLDTSEFHANAIKLYEKSGFKKVKVIPVDRTVFHEGKWIFSATVVMELTKRDFKKIAYQ